MQKSRTLFRSPLVLAIALGLSGAAHADAITDGALNVDIDNDGEFNVITLNSVDIDTSSFVQQFVGNTCNGFTGGSPISTLGSSSTYTATCGGFDVMVSSDISGALASNPAVTNVMNQVLVFTNNTAGPLPLEIISSIDQDLQGAGNDLVSFDVARQAVVATDSVDAAPATLLFASLATSNCTGGTFGFDVGLLGSQSTAFPMDNGAGPAGPGDTAVSIGFDCGTIPAGESRTVTFRNLFATDLSAVPSDFTTAVTPPPATGNGRVAVPTMSEWAMIVMVALLALMGLGALSNRRVD